MPPRGHRPREPPLPLKAEFAEPGQHLGKTDTLTLRADAGFHLLDVVSVVQPGIGQGPRHRDALHRGLPAMEGRLEFGVVEGGVGDVVLQRGGFIQFGQRRLSLVLLLGSRRRGGQEDAHAGKAERLEAAAQPGTAGPGDGPRRTHSIQFHDRFLCVDLGSSLGNVATGVDAGNGRELERAALGRKSKQARVRCRPPRSGRQRRHTSSVPARGSDQKRV